MSAKITITGARSGKLRKNDRFYAFEIETGGSANPPKGLPTAAATVVEYTVFVSLKAGRKAGLENAPRDQKWVVQGEPTIDLSVDECPGAIGVIAFQLEAISAKTEEPKPTATVESMAEPSTPKTVETPAQPQQAVAPPPIEVHTLPLTEIHVSKKYERYALNAEKTQPVMEWVKEHGRLDKPIEVRPNNGEYWLMDGYRRYVIAQELGLAEVDVRVV